MTEKKQVSLNSVFNFVVINGDPNKLKGVLEKISNQHPGLLIDKDFARRIRKGEVDPAEIYNECSRGIGFVKRNLHTNSIQEAHKIGEDPFRRRG